MNKDKSTGKLMPSFREIELYRKRFEEGANLQGRNGLLYQVQDTKSINTDNTYTYKTPVTVSYYLIENPKKSVLLKLGWYTEDSDSKPIVCYLTYLDSEGKPIYQADRSQIHYRLQEKGLNTNQIVTFISIISLACSGISILLLILKLLL